MSKSSISCSWDTVEELSSPECMVLAGGASPCEITIRSQDAIGSVHIVSNARTCELRKNEAYVSTSKASEEEDGHPLLRIDVQVRLPYDRGSFPKACRYVSTLTICFFSSSNAH